MSYRVIFSLDAVDDVLKITMSSQSKALIIDASKQIQEALEFEPQGVGEHLSEGLFYIDREPLRAFFHYRRRESGGRDCQCSPSVMSA